MADYGDPHRDADKTRQRDPSPDVNDSVVYATEPTGEIETVGVDAALAQLAGDGQPARTDGGRRPDASGQTTIADWGVES